MIIPLLSLSRWVSLPSSRFGQLRPLCSQNVTNSQPSLDSVHPVPVLDILNQCSDPDTWSNRILLQNRFSLPEKGWRVDVVWNETPNYGVAVFANQDIAKGTVLRTGYLHFNLFPLASTIDIETFCSGSLHDDTTSHSYHQRLKYVQDYLWGYFSSSCTDEQGYRYPISGSEEARFFGMWIPGNGLNHHPNPNTVYRDLPGGPLQEGIQLVALTDIAKGEELLDDYKRHGTSPMWLRRFAQEKNITLNFADCNDFVS